MQTSEPGSVHDSLVFTRSELFRQLNEENFCPFPGAMGVGDSAYKVNLGTSYISFTLKFESRQNFCSNMSIRSSTYGKKNFRFSSMREDGHFCY